MGSKLKYKNMMKESLSHSEDSDSEEPSLVAISGDQKNLDENSENSNSPRDQGQQATVKYVPPHL